MSKYAYLGPVGTFSEVALTQISKATDERIPFSNITSALNAVRSGEVIGALVPIENSVEGFVARTLDELVEGDPLVIVAETTLDRKSTRLNSSHIPLSRMPSSA